MAASRSPTPRAKPRAKRRVGAKQRAKKPLAQQAQELAAAAKKASAGPAAAKPFTKEKFSLNLTKRRKHPGRLPSVWRLSRRAALVLWSRKKLFLGIAVVYGLLNIVLVRGLSGGIDIGSLKQSAAGGPFSAGLTVFVQLLYAGSGSSSGGSGYQLFLLLIVSLAMIWALRQVLADREVRIREAFYRGPAPLVPFVLILLVLALELIPITVGAGLYSLAIGSGVAVTWYQLLLFLAIFIGLGLVSLYVIASTLWALYIVTLPEMTPLTAMRSARELVRYRRWTVLRKVLFLPLVLFIIAAVIMVPVIIVAAPAAQYVFFVLTMLSIVVIHAYLYVLYRELL